jgi:hypothetical protein
VPRIIVATVITIALAAQPAAAQVTLVGGVSAGRAFMTDSDDPDPSGSYSATVTIERRHRRSGFSLGVEAGLHEYLVLRQALPPDVTGWSSRFEDTRKSWRVTPFIRWGTTGSNARLFAQLGTGLYVREYSNLNQQREGGVLVVDQRYAATNVGAGVNLGVGVELFPVRIPVGLMLGFRTHSVLNGGDGFNTAEAGVVVRGLPP